MSGRPFFLNRDPIGEAGGLNLYGFAGNDGVNNFDYLGMETREYVINGVKVFVTDNPNEVPDNAIKLGNVTIEGFATNEERDAGWLSAAEYGRSGLDNAMTTYNAGHELISGQFGEPTTHGFFYDNETFDWARWDQGWDEILAQRRADVLAAEAELAAIGAGQPSGYDQFSFWTHTTLSGAGAVPFLGVVPDAVDWLYTAAEIPFGKSTKTDLGLATAGIAGTFVPVVGDGAAAAGKITARTLRAAKNAASDLPQMKGMGANKRATTLTDAGFQKTKVSNSAAKNETWTHTDGSEVRVHPYGNVNQTPYKSGNNAHLHKQDPGGAQLNDRGIPSPNPNQTHIGLPNPADFPQVRGRPNGS